MRIVIEGPELTSVDFDNILGIFKGEKIIASHRKLP